MGISCPRARGTANPVRRTWGDQPTTRKGALIVTALARWCYRHRLVVLLLWVGALFGLGFSASTAGTNYANVFSLPDTDSKSAYDLMEKAFPNTSGDTDTVVWKVDQGSVKDQAVRS